MAATVDEGVLAAVRAAAAAGPAAAAAVLRAVLLGARRLDLEARDAHGRTPLIEAVRSGREAAVRALLSAGASAEGTDAEGYPPLFHAVVAPGAQGIVDALLGAGADAAAAVAGRCRPGRLTALHLVAYMGLPSGADTARALLAAGASARAVAQHARTALHLASASAGGGGAAVARVLCEEGGADVDARDASGYTPLHYAARRGRLEAMDVLRRAGASLLARDASLWSPLHHAAALNQAGAVRALTGWCCTLHRAAALRARDAHRRTPLHLAVAHGARDAVAALCEPLGVLLLLARDARRHTPLSLAVESGDVAMVAYLASKGAPVSAAGVGPVPLVWGAVRDGAWDMVRLLTSLGAPVRRIAAPEGADGLLRFLRAALVRALRTLRDEWLVPERLQAALFPPDACALRRRSRRAASCAGSLERAIDADDAAATLAALAALAAESPGPQGARAAAAKALRRALARGAWASVKACLHRCDDAACEVAVDALDADGAETLLEWFVARVVHDQPDRFALHRLVLVVRGAGVGDAAPAQPANKRRRRL